MSFGRIIYLPGFPSGTTSIYSAIAVAYWKSLNRLQTGDRLSRAMLKQHDKMGINTDPSQRVCATEYAPPAFMPTMSDHMHRKSYRGVEDANLLLYLKQLSY